MACICGHTAGSAATQRIHENNCTASQVVAAPARVVKKAIEKVTKVVKRKK